MSDPAFTSVDIMLKNECLFSLESSNAPKVGEIVYMDGKMYLAYGRTWEVKRGPPHLKGYDSLKCSLYVKGPVERKDIKFIDNNGMWRESCYYV